MSDEGMKHDDTRSVGCAYLVYAQVAGVMGAIGLLGFLAHFFDIGWRGALADLLGFWNLFVRPAMKWLLDTTVVALVKVAFHWRIEIPVFWRDYLATGFILLLSSIRAQRVSRPRFARTFEHIVNADPELNGIQNASEIGYRPFMIRSIFLSLLSVALWPLSLIASLTFIAVTNWREPLSRVFGTYHLLALSPIFYFALLYALNSALQTVPG